MGEPVSIGELSRRVGLNIETIRYYERISLVPRPPRTARRRRQYDEGAVGTLAFVRKARELYFSIDDIRALLKLRGSEDACADVQAIASRHLQAIRDEERRNAEVARILSEALERCPGKGAAITCTVLEVLEHAARYT